jgi:hypothetical protein
MLKRFGALLALVLVCTAAGFVGGMFATRNFERLTNWTQAGTAVARNFKVVDEHGKVRAQLTQNGLDLFGNDGRVRATLRLIYNDNGVLGFSVAKWEGRAVFGFIGTDTPSPRDDNWGLLIHSPDMRRPVIGLETDNGGRQGYLSVWNDKGAQTFGAPR